MGTKELPVIVMTPSQIRKLVDGALGLDRETSEEVEKQWEEYFQKLEKK